MDTDIRDAIERSFGEGPNPAVTADALVGRGRAALRRRRLAESASIAAVTVLAAVGVALSVGGGADRAAPEPAAPSPTHAVDPSRGASPTPLPTFPPAVDAEPIRDPGLRRSWPVAAQPDGLHVSTRVRVLKVVDDPWHYRAEGAWSVALVYRDHTGLVTWWAGYTDEHGGGSSASIPAKYARMDFPTWVDTMNDGLGYGKDATPPTPGGSWPGRVRVDLVRFASPTSERVVPLDAVTLLDEREHPDLPESWARPEDRSAAAEVRFEGVRYYVLARSTGDGGTQTIAVKAAKGGATLDDFLEMARQRYAEGGGGLL